MKKYKTLILILTFICVIIIVVSIIATKKTNVKQDTAQFDEYDVDKIEQIKEEVNASADTEMYKIEEEYDGRKIIQIKPNIQFETVLAGILENDKPQEDKIQSILKNLPQKNGIWTSEKSRVEFIKLLNDNNIKQFEIDEEGYLNLKEESNDNNYKIIKRAIDSDKKYILDISGKCYIRDDYTGEIVEYPFEKMEPDQAVEVYDNENYKIIEITTNSAKKLTSQEILTDIILNLE